MEWLKDLLCNRSGQGSIANTECSARSAQDDQLTVWICSIRDPDFSDESYFQALVNNHASTKESESIRKFLFFDDRRRSLGSLLLQKALIQSTFADIFTNGQKYSISRTREVRAFPDRVARNETPDSSELIQNKPFLAKESFTSQTQDRLQRWNYNVSHHGDFVGIVGSFAHLVGMDIVDTHTRSSFAKTPVEYVYMFREQLTPYELDYILEYDSYG